MYSVATRHIAICRIRSTVYVRVSVKKWSILFVLFVRMHLISSASGEAARGEHGDVTPILFDICSEAFASCNYIPECIVTIETKRNETNEVNVWNRIWNEFRSNYIPISEKCKYFPFRRTNNLRIYFGCVLFTATCTERLSVITCVITHCQRLKNELSYEMWFEQRRKK